MLTTAPGNNPGSSSFNGRSVQKLTTTDIKDMREYERERDDFRRRIIDMKRRRRIELGTIMSMVFENTDTMRWQVQEMARAERMLRDEQIAHEVETYNQLIPDAGELSATLMLELTSESQLREWLPKLVGVQRSVLIVVDDLPPARGVPQDEERLTREETTAAVHFLRFTFTPEQIGAFERGPVRIVIDHPQYREEIELSDTTRKELAADLQRA
jgi:Protein of unknown function (DUF3501)